MLFFTTIIHVILDLPIPLNTPQYGRDTHNILPYAYDSKIFLIEFNPIKSTQSS